MRVGEKGSVGQGDDAEKENLCDNYIPFYVVCWTFVCAMSYCVKFNNFHFLMHYFIIG